MFTLKDFEVGFSGFRFLEVDKISAAACRDLTGEEFFVGHNLNLDVISKV